jgi:cytochrome c biogenesis protein CcmG/thiol:disulfide interchange protein DsbE
MNRRSLLEPVAACLVAFLGVLLTWHLLGSSPRVTGTGQAAPDFKAETLSGGRSFELSQLAGRLIVLNFWASWCGPCKDEAAVLTQLAKRYAKDVVSFVGVDVRDAASDARAFVDRYRISYTVARDTSDEAESLYGVGSLPATFIISPQGRVLDQLTGAVTGRQLRRSIERALATTT